MKPNWHKIEEALIETCLAYSIEVVRNNDSGDAFADMEDFLELNITDIAKDLEKRL